VLLEDASVDLFMAAFLSAVEDKVREALLDDDVATQAVMGSAPRSVTVAALPSGAQLYTFTVSVPLSALAPPATRRRLSVARRLQASVQDSLTALLTDGTLTQKLLESGVGDAQDLIDSGALGVAGATVEPSQSPLPSPVGTSGVVQLGGLPPAAFDGAGMLMPAAVSSIASALTAGVATACPACTVRVTRVVNSATGAVVFAAARRRLATATYTVTFFVAGAGAAAAVAGINTAVVGAQLSTSLGVAITVTVPAAGPDAPSGLAPGGVAGVAVAAFLLLAAAVGVWCYKKKAAEKVKATVAAAPKAGLAINAPTTGPTVVVQQAPPTKKQ